MRTRKMSNTRFAYKLDKFFWLFLALFPYIAYLFYIGKNPGVTFYDFFNTVLGVGGYGPNIVYQTLDKIFGPSSSVFRIFNNTSALYFFVWLVNVELVHIFYDVIVFIPRLAHKWISKAVQDD